MAGRSTPVSRAGGFTLIELLTVLAIVSSLIAVGGLFYSRLIDKARAVEAEIALSEINRLEQIYYASNGSYTTNMNELGFRPFQPMKYYTLSVQVLSQQGTSAFRAFAVPVAGAGTGQTFSVVQYANPAMAGGVNPATITSSSGMAFGGEGWSDEGIVRIETGPSSRGGIEKVVQHQRPDATPPPQNK
ncbi:hypothetical protein W02_33890 [Nitrospira sp. KM1]|uniref:type IV pilin protein n=1 Tax=Nitrospira sp. KM1 TaxID=1936990 RepID=UPI0013A74CE9|nr:type IV pilin protein [Nitrospira sp. KM1]BCA56249.1 hypothetical protein W02_33890 [Nitrospira sp. KM1]